MRGKGRAESVPKGSSCGCVGVRRSPWAAAAITCTTCSCPPAAFAASSRCGCSRQGPGKAAGTAPACCERPGRLGPSAAPGCQDAGVLTAPGRGQALSKWLNPVWVQCLQLHSSGMSWWPLAAGCPAGGGCVLGHPQAHEQELLRKPTRFEVLCPGGGLQHSPCTDIANMPGRPSGQQHIASAPWALLLPPQPTGSRVGVCITQTLAYAPQRLWCTGGGRPTERIPVPGPWPPALLAGCSGSSLLIPLCT